MFSNKYPLKQVVVPKTWLTSTIAISPRREEALAAAQDAADLYRDLARARPEAFTPNLAMSLNNLANCLSALGRREEALAAAQDAADLYCDLARARPEAFTPDGFRRTGRRENLDTVVSARQLAPLLRSPYDGLVYYMLEARKKTRGRFRTNQRVAKVMGRGSCSSGPTS